MKHYFYISVILTHKYYFYISVTEDNETLFLYFRDSNT
jgi:hypothetical protein